MSTSTQLGHMDVDSIRASLVPIEKPLEPLALGVTTATSVTSRINAALCS